VRENLKIAVVTPKSINGERGGAENLYEGLVQALKTAGHSAIQIEIPVDESSFEKILESYCYCYYLDLNNYDCVISTKAPTYMVQHKNHISYLLHTIRVFYDMFEIEYDVHDREKQKQRQIIQAFDRYALDPARIKKQCAIGKTVVDRLKKSNPFWDQINFKVIYPATRLSAFNSPCDGQFIFLPGRLHRWKRVDLIIKAMAFVKSPVKLVIAGKGEDEENLRKLVKTQGLEGRVQFLGTISDSELLDLYSKSIVIPFVPINEDYGYITIEAFKSKKPVITCKDSGEPANIVKDTISGFVVEPDPRAIAEKINYFIDNPEKISQMGNAGFESVRNITWDTIVSELLEDFATPQKNENEKKINVLVTDMQPIEPAVGGGRMRLKGLYSNLSSNIECSYIGTYDWRGEKYRKINISDRFTETTIPLSEEHFRLNDYINNLLPGKTIIDVDFSLLSDASPDYTNAVCKEAAKSDVIIFSHPWVYPTVSTKVDLRNKIVIYDSQNCEYVLRDTLLGSTTFARCLSQNVRFVEKGLCERADLILACSEEDRSTFIKYYQVNAEKIKIFPNGVDVKKIMPASEKIREMSKEKLNITQTTAIFIGSNYGPNIEAGQFIIDELAKKCSNVLFLIVGGSCTSLNAKEQDNVRLCGTVSEEDKITLFAASDIAINPMSGGSGTNIKMFDYLSAGLPTITTPVGGRGINNPDAFIVVNKEEFAQKINNILSDKPILEQLSKNGRSLVEREYDWNKISQKLGREINAIYSERYPFFSVVIPTFRSNDYLQTLFDKLNRQLYKDFEVIVIDSGKDKGHEYQELCNFKLTYLFRPDIGAAKARNIGIDYARGKFVAFTDDDCQPDADWLSNAKKHLTGTDLCGLEGFVYTDEDKINDPNYRIVTNKGFEGIGFITANLIIKTDILRKINGFDVRFDKPHFREDTDLGWRALEYGRIPYAKDVRVYHPPLLRSLNGESSRDRDYFFVNDAILFSKFPEKYIRLMKAEGHYKYNKNFWKYFIRGCEMYHTHIQVGYMLNDKEIFQHVPDSLKSCWLPYEQA
jgi:glycosyltransferase involved in cell wall biosynthesis